MSLRADRLRSAVGRVVNAVETRQAKQLAALRSSASLLASHFRARGQATRAELEEVMQRIRRVGVPPSFVELAGISDLERPFNRLLAWWVNEDAEHGLAREFVERLAVRLGFSELVEDVRAGQRIESKSETSTDESTSARRPDLLLRTRHAALMIENKVHARESGPGQYAEYLDVLADWGRDLAHRAVLCARDALDPPPGWDHFLQHRELAAILRKVAEAPSAPRWGRVSAIVCAVAFEDDRGMATRTRRALELMRLSAAEESRPGEIAEMQTLLRELQTAASAPRP